jgi:phage shock protein PspC (stress-responsive transcriptional regulator)
MERISVTARLNRSTLQFEEAAYTRLEAYFAEAASTLEGNPDRAEILADLEQAVADQCARRMRPNQSVIAMNELVPALEEIGAVQVPGAASAPEQPPREASRPLQQVSEGALISGVCQGLAQYFGLDVTLLRVVAVLLLFVTGGAMIPVYLILMLLLPFAPLRPGGPRIRWIPAKSREFVGFIRSKLSTATS